MSTHVGVAVPAPSSSEPFEARALDLPGCFASGIDEAAALSALSAVIDRYLAIAAEAGAAAPARPTGPIEIVERFYGSRLQRDPEAVRSAGLGGEPDATKRLELIRAWALERLAALPALGALERMHGGERWTPRKVIRRYG